MTNKLTNKDHLTLVVERAVRGGWKPKGVEDIDEPYYLDRKEVSYGEYYIHHNPDSLPKLISDSEFMKAVYGEEKVCRQCGKKDTSTSIMGCTTCCAACRYNLFDWAIIPASRYHMHKAFDIIWDKGNPIQYLYDSLPEMKI